MRISDWSSDVCSSDLLDLPIETIRETEDGKILEQRTPLGVVGAITPWNFPVILLVMKLAPGLSVGNTMIAKPAPTTPLTTAFLGEIAADILPPGVRNLIIDANALGGPGRARVGQECASPC